MIGFVAPLLSWLVLAGGGGEQCREPIRPPTGNVLVMSLRLELSVVDSESKPVHGTAVRFKDVAPPIAQRDDGRLLGVTGADGVLNVDVTHEWDDYFGADRRADSGAFDLLIQARNGEHIVRHFVIECLSKEGPRYLLTLRVFLSRSRDSIIIR